MKTDIKVAVIGLGYVGLPLAIEFGKLIPTIGFDISEKKISELKRNYDATGETSDEDRRSATKLQYTYNLQDLSIVDFFIVAVPTPINQAKQPDFQPLLSASEIIGRVMKTGATVVYESTVYPGATEEICIPVLEKFSGKKWKEGFYVGYSPERINPGDKQHTLKSVIKVVSGDTAETSDKLKKLYALVVDAGIHVAPSMKVAEAAKVIENTQRDLNIAFMNELSIIFHRLGIDTTEVLQAAGTKWNFLKFYPGLVGGHCIGVDPYYLTHKAEMSGYHPEVILSGRRINDSMGKHIADRLVKLMVRTGTHLSTAVVNILGLTFKENCPDLRNSKVPDIVSELKSFGITVNVYDPLANPEESLQEYGIRLMAWDTLPRADGLVVAVAHSEFCGASATSKIQGVLKTQAAVFDVKSILEVSRFRDQHYVVDRL
jgi:UDP-N-acetyl-D-galactosamine dehydrogenase